MATVVAGLNRTVWTVFPFFEEWTVNAVMVPRSSDPIPAAASVANVSSYLLGQGDFMWVRSANRDRGLKPQLSSEETGPPFKCGVLWGARTNGAGDTARVRCQSKRKYILRTD